MAESDPPNPSGTIIYFFLITIAYAVFVINKISSTEDINQGLNNANNKNDSILYIILLVVGSYFINASVSKAICGSIQWDYVSFITLIPWAIIFGSLFFMLTLFVGWATPFSNTIGYFVISCLEVDKTYDKIFKTGQEASGNVELIKALANMNSNRTKFVNQISSDVVEFITFFNNIKDAVKDDVKSEVEKFKTTLESPPSLAPLETRGGAPPNKANPTSKEADPPSKETDPPLKKVIPPLVKLYNLLVIKQFIGKIVWYILAGILISSISYNLLISMSCKKSLAQIKKEFETAEKDKAKQAELKANGF